MTSARRPPCFAFDFGRADRVAWRHGRGNGEFERNGTPAGFFVDDSAIADEFSSRLPPSMADLVDIAVAVHTADRLALRTVEYAGNWGRRLGVKLSVRCPEMWMAPLVAERLERLLRFLTEDVWRLSFVPRQDSLRSSELQGHLFPGGHDGDIEVSLFSGGLDSFAGTAARASELEKHFVLVSAYPSSRQRSYQQRQVQALREQFACRISHVCVPYGIHHGDEYAQEPSRRTRGFLFLILGGVTALSGRASSLYLYENGMGAMNLPYDHAQIGTDNGRAVHPRVLREVGEILTLVGGRPFLIENRCIYKTKAEMLREPAVARVRNAIPLTFSCDGFPVRARGRAQCGFCTSCVLRRYSLEVAGLAEVDSNGYLQDWKSASFKPARHHLRGLRAMDWQVLRIERCFGDSSPWSALALAVQFPELRLLAHELSLTNSLCLAGVEEQLVRLLRQHTADWRTFSALQLLRPDSGKAA